MERSLIEQARESAFWANWRLHLTIPSVLGSGENFALRLTAFGPDGLPSADFGREIAFQASPGVEGLPRSVRFDPAGGGHLTVAGLKAVGPNRAWVTAVPEGCPTKLHSNPAWVFASPPWRIYWGDLHVHTTFSNCWGWACKDPEFCYAFAREAAHLDFAAAADHLRGIASDATRWPRLQQLARQEETPGKFVPFLAFESSHKTGFGGDINAYFRDADGSYFWLERADMRGNNPEVTLRELWNFLDAAGREYFTIPHHTGRADKYRSFADAAYDPRRERLFEIYSWWGSSEARHTRYPLAGGNAERPAYFTDALNAGCRYGVIASGDDHLTMPGGEGLIRQPGGPHQLTNYVHHGLAAVRAPELSRTTLWTGLKNRSCYGTTFTRALLDFRVGEIQMGCEAHVSRNDPLRTRRELRVDLLTEAAAPANISLSRNGQEIAQKRWQAAQAAVVFEDDEPLDAVAIREAPFHPEPFVTYRVRVESGPQTLWSSPLWLDL